MKSVELIIDIGSKTTTVAQKGKGVVLKEPSMVLLESRRKKMRLVEAGKGVAKYVNHTRADEQIIAPVRGGIVMHEFAAALMYKEFLLRIVPYRLFFRPPIKVIACVSCGLTNTEKNQIENVLTDAGANEVLILESPLAVAAGLESGSAHFLIDVGATKTEVAIVGTDGIVAACTVNIGGDTFNNALIDYVTDTKRCRMSPATAEKVKRNIGSMYENDTACMSVELEEIGTDRVYSYKIYAKDFKTAIEPLIGKIVEVTYHLSFQIPESMAQEICRNGITVSGGSSYIPGLCEYIDQAMRLVTRQAEDPLNAVVKGGAYYAEHPERLGEVLNVAGLRKN